MPEFFLEIIARRDAAIGVRKRDPDQDVPARPRVVWLPRKLIRILEETGRHARIEIPEWFVVQKNMSGMR